MIQPSIVRLETRGPGNPRVREAGVPSMHDNILSLALIALRLPPHRFLHRKKVATQGGDAWQFYQRFFPGECRSF